ncbi:hypothetical protein G7046_g5979 [Stylonectria norvegica]|nr:hypothetical protein G7046_g5979 [Stylonectria norvegica]
MEQLTFEESGNGGADAGRRRAAGSLGTREPIPSAQRPFDVEASGNSPAAELNPESVQEIFHVEQPPTTVTDHAPPQWGISEELAPEIYLIHPFFALPPTVGISVPGAPRSSSHLGGITSETDLPESGTSATSSAQPNHQLGSSESDRCSCVEDLLRLVERLDNDDFQLKTLSFDQVLKVQKWLTFNCLQPLGCANCSNKPAVHSIILIIFERVMRMFQCLSRRLKQPQVNLAETDTSGTFTTFSCLSRAVNATETPPSSQMLDTTDFAGTSIRCNPEMFSHEFRGQYSNEEQFHMIQVLAGIQVKNFDKLLVRLTVLHSGSPTGQATKVGQHDAYLSTPDPENARNSVGILYIPDVIGIWTNSKLIADEFASQGYTTLIIDIFNGDAIKINELANLNLVDYIQNGRDDKGGHTTKEIDPIIKEALDYMKTELGLQHIGAVGYCFGAKYVVRHYTSGIKVGYIAHPSFVEEEELASITGPLSIAAAEIDPIFPAEHRYRSEQILKENGNVYQVNLYSGVEHGFAVRRELSQSHQIFARDQAFLQAVIFFNTWLV